MSSDQSVVFTAVPLARPRCMHNSLLIHGALIV